MHAEIAMNNNEKSEKICAPIVKLGDLYLRYIILQIEDYMYAYLKKVKYEKRCGNFAPVV